MPLSNTSRSYGGVARALHWLTALLILTAIPLGWIANRLPYDSAEALAGKAQLFSLHKSLGVAAFAVALARILWALGQPRPAPLHPERRLETALAETVHWLLYLSLLLVPLAGWVHHAATTGFAPILWPFGQDLPFVPKSETVAGIAAAAHWLFARLLILSLVLHIAGALKHHLIDRDSVLRRMTRGEAAPEGPVAPHRVAPALAALAVYALGAGIAVALVPPKTEAQPALAAVTSDWVVTEGELGFTVRQMGAKVEGSFADWTAAIRFDETPVEGRNGEVTVTIATGSLTLGSVTEQAKAPEFFDSAAQPTAIFAAEIRPEGEAYVAEGALTLRGVTVPVTLPFTLELDGDTAKMAGGTTLDRRDFAMGASYADEASVGFAVEVDVALTASRGE